MSEPSARRPTGRGPRKRKPVARLLLGLLALLLALTTLTFVAPATPARANTKPFTIALDSVTVTGLGTDAVVTVSGTVTNTSAAPMFGVRVALWRSTEQLRSLSTVLDALATDRSPAGLTLRDKPSESVVLTAPTIALAPGSSAVFSVSGTVDDLSWTLGSSYWVGAHVTASATAGGATDTALTTQGKTLVTLPGTTSGTSVASVVDLSATPRRLRPGLFADDGLATELAPSGRLSRLLNAAAGPDTSWAIDPSLLDEVTDMADGYRVVDAAAGSREGTGQADAAAWLAAFRQLSTAFGVQTLYGHPDLVGSDGDAGVLDRALAATKAGGSSLRIVALASRVSTPMLDALAARGIPVLTTAAGTGSPTLTVAGAQVLAAVSLDAPWTSGVIRDTPAARAAATVAIARAAGGQVRLLRTPAEADLDLLASPSWLTRVPVASFLSKAPLGAAAEIADPPSASGGLTPTLLGLIDRLTHLLTSYGSAAPKSGLKDAAAALASNAASEAWLDDGAARASYLDAVEQRSHALAIAGGITLTAPNTVTMSSNESQFPATITNLLPDAITVRVVGDSDSPARMRVSPSDWVTIQPNDSYTAQVPASARANGAVRVTLRVETQDGLQVSAPVRATLEATNLGFVGWIIVAASGLMLVVTTGLRIRQVRRRRAP